MKRGKAEGSSLHSWYLPMGPRFYPVTKTNPKLLAWKAQQGPIALAYIKKKKNVQTLGERVSHSSNKKCKLKNWK